MRIFCGCFLVALLAAPVFAGDAYVVFWFDTEDYLTPESDDAAMRLARILSERGIRGTFKVTGEKARVLERRGRLDVLAALRRHDIGYHTDFHSVPPAPAAYLDRLGWDEGVEEFYRREAGGARDVARILRRPLSCYGQPGNSWGPQTYPALRRMGIAMYLDSGRQVGLNEDLFWYAGTLNFFNLGKKETRLRLGANPEQNLAKATAEFDAVFRQLRDRVGAGSVISIIYHPWEFVSAKAWDAVNFAYGANPQREKWQPAPLKPPHEQDRDYAAFTRYVDHIRNTPGVKFATGSDLVRLYPDRARGRRFSRPEILDLARRAREEVSFWQDAGGSLALSAAEVFSLLVQALDPARSNFRAEDWMGPRHRGRSTRREAAARWEIRDAASTVQAYARKSGHLPGEVWLGSESLSPEDFLLLVAQSVLDPAQATFSIAAAKFVPARHVADDADNLWGWLIHPKGMRAPELMELARLQSWTLKPAFQAPVGSRQKAVASRQSAVGSRQ